MRMTLLSQKRTKLTADSTLRERLQSAIVRAQALARAGLEKGPEIATRSPRSPCVRACRRNYGALIDKRNLACLHFVRSLVRAEESAATACRNFTVEASRISKSGAISTKASCGS